MATFKDCTLQFVLTFRCILTILLWPGRPGSMLGVLLVFGLLIDLLIDESVILKC